MGTFLRSLLVLCPAVALGCGAGASADAAGETAAEEALGTTTSIIKKVFVVVMENKQKSEVYGNPSAPYINGTLMARYKYATSYANVAHPSEPNYVWLEAGSNEIFDHTFTGDDDPSASNSTRTTLHLTRFLKHKGISWKAYQEGLDGTTGACPVKSHSSSPSFYAAKHNPFVFFQDIAGAPPSSTNAYCTRHIKPFSELGSDLENDAVASYSFITPNLCNDMHGASGCPSSNTVAMGDSWLKNDPTMQRVMSYVLTPANHAILLIVWDESDNGGQTLPMVLVAPESTLDFSSGHANATPLSHSSTVKALQRIFQVAPGFVDPTTGKEFGWLRNAAGASVNGFYTFFVPGQYP
jgi:phosphatidylinositol-3-phosphatase